MSVFGGRDDSSSLFSGGSSLDDGHEPVAPQSASNPEPSAWSRPDPHQEPLTQHQQAPQSAARPSQAQQFWTRPAPAQTPQFPSAPQRKPDQPASPQQRPQNPVSHAPVVHPQANHQQAHPWQSPYVVNHRPVAPATSWSASSTVMLMLAVVGLFVPFLGIAALVMGVVAMKNRTVGNRHDPKVVAAIAIAVLGLFFGITQFMWGLLSL